LQATLEKIIFQMLSANGTVDSAEYPALAAAARRCRRTLLEHLVAEGKVSEEEVALCVAEKCGLEMENVDAYSLPRELNKLVPAQIAQRSRVIPIESDNGTLCVAAAEPLPPTVLENLQRISRKRVVVRIATRSAVAEGLKLLYGQGESEAEGGPELTSAVELVDGLLSDAMQQRASDIHLEPEENRLRVRFRVDGMLREYGSHPKAMVAPVVTRLKVLTRLNIAEKRSPQDGSFFFDHNGERIDVRVSTLPSLHGEKVVLRLLASKSRRITLEQLGMEPDTLEDFRRLISRPHGIILITGPTGSGKSTTLFASLLTIRSSSINITTVEDPIEYQIEGVTQTQVDQAQKMTFAKALRAMLRQDPDVIMVGEIRDRETADIALRAALTGHLVFSTLHTNDASSALARLVDMGCEPYLVASSVCGILAQRLVRVNCEACREEYKPPPEVLERLKIEPGAPLYRGRGCPKCNHTGFRGRVGIFELLSVDEDIRGAIVNRASTDVIRRMALSKGMRLLRDDSLLKVRRGTTTPEEALRETTVE